MIQPQTFYVTDCCFVVGWKEKSSLSPPLSLMD